MRTKKSDLYIVYILAIIGDSIAGTIFVSTIMYGTKIGLSTIEVGLIGSAYGLSYVIMPPLLGKIGDKIARKSSLLIATLGQTILALFLTFVVLQEKSFIFIGFFLALILYGVMFSFFWPSIEAYISENTEHSPRAHEQGIANFCIAWSIGYTFGPLFAGFFLDYNIILAFIFAFSSFLACFLLVFFGLPSIKPINKKNQINKVTSESNKSNRDVKSPNKISNANKLLILLVMGVMVYSTITRVILSYFPNYAVLSTGLGWTGTLTGQVMFFFGLGRTCYFIIGRFLKNSFVAITQSFFATGICLIVVIFITDAPIYMFIFFICGFFMGRTYLVSLELLLKYEQEEKGAKAGIFECVIGFGVAFTPLIAGLIAAVDLKLPFILFSISAFIFVIIHLILQKNLVLEKVPEK
ncbi:MAG: MFS transporter [Promethearchaeota archaeon]